MPNNKTHEVKGADAYIIDVDGNLVHAGKTPSLTFNVQADGEKLKGSLASLIEAMKASKASADSASISMMDFGKIEHLISTPSGNADFFKQMEKLSKQKQLGVLYGAGPNKLLDLDSIPEAWLKSPYAPGKSGWTDTPACENPGCGFHKYVKPKGFHGHVKFGNGPVFGSTTLMWYSTTVNGVNITSRLCSACFSIMTGTWDSPFATVGGFCENVECELHNQPGTLGVFKYVVTDLSSAYFMPNGDASVDPILSNTHVIHRHVLGTATKANKFEKHWFCDRCVSAFTMKDDLNE